MICALCCDYGVIKIPYESGEPYDLAICACRCGQPYRDGGPALVRARLSVPEGHDIAWLEDFTEQPLPTAVYPVPVDVGQAGKMRKAGKR